MAPDREVAGFVHVYRLADLDARTYERVPVIVEIQA
jgi:hypothetical protein